MNTGKGILLKLVSAVLFALMSALIRYLGARYPIGQVVFYRSAFAIVPVMLVYAWRGELASVVRTERPLGQAGRGALSIVGMFCNFGALARLPLVESNAISFTSPLFSVALAALILKERVRIYRWSAVIGPLYRRAQVVLAPHIAGDVLAFAMASAAPRVHCITNAVAQHYTANMLLAAGAVPSMTISPEEIGAFVAGADALLVNLGTFGWLERPAAIAVALGTAAERGGTGSYFLTESYRYASSFARPRRAQYVARSWALVLGYIMFGETPTLMIVALANDEAADAAARFAQAHATIVALTGDVDVVADGTRRLTIANGDPLMALVTAMGCAGSALISAALAVEVDIGFTRRSKSPAVISEAISALPVKLRRRGRAGPAASPPP